MGRLYKVPTYPFLRKRTLGSAQTNSISFRDVKAPRAKQKDPVEETIFKPDSNPGQYKIHFCQETGIETIFHFEHGFEPEYRAGATH
jgi:hypothetical protein